MKHIDLSPFEGQAMTDADWQHLMMRVLFAPRAELPSYAESIIEKAEKHSGLNAEQPDPLLTMLGFNKDNLPKMTTTFNSAMGHLFEAVLRIVLKLSGGSLYSDDFSEATSLLTEEEIATFKKIKADCLFGSSAIEIKYRYASSEGLTKQKQARIPLQKMGFKPVFLCFRRSPRIDELRNAGWEVYEGQEAIEYIQERTGYDISHIFSLAMTNPLIKKRIELLQSRYVDNIKAKLEADFAWALDGHREPVHRMIAEDDTSRREFLEDAGFEDDLIRGFVDHIFKEKDSLAKNEQFTSFAAEFTKHNDKSNSAPNLFKLAK